LTEVKEGDEGVEAELEAEAEGREGEDEDEECDGVEVRN
jgi:hypothetical protein